MPGVALAMMSRSTSAHIRLSRAWTSRIARRSSNSGSGTTIWRSKRPGRSSAGSRMSGRFVAARITMPSAVSKPSISDSIWFSVCSRSSWPPPRPAPRLRPIESISSMKMIARPMRRACWNRSRTRLAPTPTNISMKSEPVTDRNPTPASPATARANSVLPVPGGPTSSMPLGTRAPISRKRSGIRRKSTTSVISSLTPVVAGDVGERRRRLVGRVGLGPAAPDGHHVAHLAGGPALHPHEEADDQQHGQQQPGDAQQPVVARRLELVVDARSRAASPRRPPTGRARRRRWCGTRCRPRTRR